MVQIVCSGIERIDHLPVLTPAATGAEFPEPKAPPKQLGAVGEQREEEGGDQRPEAPKKAKPTAPPAEMRTKNQ